MGSSSQSDQSVETTAVRMRLSAVRRSVRALPSPHVAVAVAEGCRLAVASVLDPRRTGRYSVPLLGKDAEDRRRDTDHGHAHYLAWSSDPSSWGLIDTLVTWAPGGLPDEAVRVLEQIRQVHGPGFQSCRVRVEAVGHVEDVAPGLVGHPAPQGSQVGPARRWRSFTPFAPPRNVRRQPTWMAHARSYLERNLASAGLPRATIDTTDGQWGEFRRHRRREPTGAGRRAQGFTLTFAEPVRGPICLGALRHLGLGLFLPVDAHEPEMEARTVQTGDDVWRSPVTSDSTVDAPGP